MKGAPVRSPLSTDAGRKVAVFDVGTNTVLYLLAARGEKGGLAVLDEDVAPTRLGEGITRGEPSAAAVARTLDALAAYKERARERGATDYLIVGTEVLRRGVWRRDFIAAASARLGVAPQVLSPEEEGALVLLAARRSLALGAAPAVAVDVGGGSAQVARERRRGSPPEVASYRIGCVWVTEEFLRPGDEVSWERARDYIRGELAAAAAARGSVVVAGGTAAALAALEQRLAAYDASRVHGFPVTPALADEWAARVYAMPLADRRRLAGMPEGRADIFPAGALALAEILSTLETPRAVVSAQGVRYGVAYRFFDGQAKR